MEPNLYRAAAGGNIEPFWDNEDLRRLVTLNKNTVLHVCIASQIQNRGGERVLTEFVEGILERCPALLMQVNDKGDAPLHLAAKYGHHAVVEFLIRFARNQPRELEDGVENVRLMLRMINEEQNTALHEAVQHNSLDVVRILMRTDAGFSYSANRSGQTPLYIAAARGSREMVAAILENRLLAAPEGPNGKNALHAAVINLNDEGAIEQLLENRRSLSREIDHHGWTPLHHAAYLGYDDAVTLLLRYDDASCTACIADKERKMTSLHLAASQGNKRIVNEIIRLCPECCDMIDTRGWNILHFAMVNIECIDDLRGLLEAYPILINLLNEKDMKGNTPLHVLATIKRQSSYQYIPFTSKGYYHAVNNKNISVQHIIQYGYPELEKEIQELSKDVGSGRQYYKGVISIPGHVPSKVYEKIRQSHLLAAVLIATVSFAAAFTIPGGYSSDGIAVLMQKGNKAFQAFIISDTIAMLLSLSAVFIHFLISIDAEEEYPNLFAAAGFFTMISMGAIAIAFVTGTYAILAPPLGLVIITCFIAFFFVGLIVLENYVRSRFNVNLINFIIN